MMDRLRESATGLGMKIILGLIMLSFMIGGVSAYLVGGGSNNLAAKVNGEKISEAAFENTFQNYRSQLQAQSAQEGKSDQFAQAMSNPDYVNGLRKEVLDNLIQQALILQYADTLGLHISDAQITDIIRANPQFQVDGVFNQELYQNTFARSHVSSKQYAQSIRVDELQKQIQEFFVQSEFVVDKEIELPIKLVTQQREIQTATLKLTDFNSQVDISDDEIEQFYNANIASFSRPEEMKISYLELSAEKLRDSLQITDEEAQIYYQDHIDLYSSEENRQLAHIQFSDEASAKDALAKLNSGEDFGDLAKELSTDTGSADKGGDLGWFDPGVLAPTFDKIAFALANVGDISEIFQLDSSYHIVKLIDHKPAQAKPFEQVKDQIMVIMLDEKAKNEFFTLQSELTNVAYEQPDSLKESSEVIGGMVETTDFITLDNLDGVLNSDLVKSALLTQDVKKGNNSDVIEVAPEHVIVVRIDDTNEAHTLSLDEVKDSVLQQLTREKALAIANEKADSLIKALQAGDENVLAENELEFSSVAVVNRQNPLFIFDMPKPEEGKSSYAKRNDENGDLVIVKLNKVVEENIPAQDFEAIKSRSQYILLEQNIDSILKSLKEDASIDYYI